MAEFSKPTTYAGSEMTPIWGLTEDGVKKTGRVVVVHEAPKTCGFGAELVALINEKAFLSLEAPPVRAFIQKMETEQARAIYRQRGAIAEFPNAWIKEKLGLRQFHVRGLAKVRLEALWACLTYNIQQWIRACWQTKLQTSTT